MSATSIGGTTPLETIPESSWSMNRNLPDQQARRRDHRTDHAGDHGLDEERQLGVPAGGADQAHHAHLGAARERRDLHRVGDQQQRGDGLHEGERERHVADAAEEVEELRDDVALVDHVAHADLAGHRLPHRGGAGLLVGQLHAQRGRQRLRPHHVGERLARRTAACSARRPAAGSRTARSPPAASSPGSPCRPCADRLAAVGVGGRDVRGRARPAPRPGRCRAPRCGRSCARPAARCRPAPSEIAVVSTIAIVIVTLRRRPVRTSRTTKSERIAYRPTP